jgi:hypothetical protein
MWEFYTPKIQILEFFPNTEEGWKEANLVEKRLIKHDFNNPLCLNEAYGAFISLAFRSEGGKKGATKTNEKKDKNGKSLAGVKGSEKTNAQIWESTIDGFRGNAGNVSRHNRANGWDPNARIRVN